MLMLPVVNKAVFVSPSWCFNSRLSVCLVGRTQEPHPGLWDFPVLLVHKTTNRPASTTLNVKTKTEKYSHFSLWFKRLLSQLSRHSKLLSFETVWRRDYWVNTKWAISLVYMLKPLITLIVATSLVSFRHSDVKGSHNRSKRALIACPSQHQGCLPFTPSKGTSFQLKKKIKKSMIKPISYNF